MERPSEIGSSIVIKGEIIAHEDLLVVFSIDLPC